MNGRVWDNDEIDLVYACINQGWKHSDISNELNRSLPALRGLIQKLGITSKLQRKLTNKEIDERLIYKDIKRLDNYIDAKTKINFKCNICKYTWKTSPDNVTRLSGCPNCALKNKTLTNEEIDNRLENKTFKRLSNYINIKTKLKFECLICNNIWKARPDIITEGHGCPSCADISLNNEIIDNRLKNRSIKRIDNYINDKTNINFQCLKCNNIWRATTNNVTRNRGCPICAKSGFKEDKPAVTYCIYFKEFDLYKVGISNNYIGRMYTFGSKPEIVFIREFEHGKDARKLEAQWLENIKEHLVNTGSLRSGNTETFRINNAD